MERRNGTDDRADRSRRAPAWCLPGRARRRRGGLVVVQEIFGVNHHMRTVCDRFADAGYAVIAPGAVRPGGARRGTRLWRRGPQARHGAARQVPSRGHDGGRRRPRTRWAAGTSAWSGIAGAARSPGGAPLGPAFEAAVGWYGGGIAAAREETPHCSVQLHFGAEDHGIPSADVEAIRAAQPGVELYVYPGAGHGFGCDERDSFDAAAAPGPQPHAGLPRTPSSRA